MDPSIRQALENPNLEVQRELIREYQFQLKDIPIPITIRLYRRLGTDVIEFRQSHYIRTPVQAGRYRTDSSWGENEAAALRRAIQTLVSFYEDAVRVGKAPAESWLLKNDSF